MEGIIENIEIAGIASCVPKHFEDNMDYGNVLGERRVKRQIRLTGIRKDIQVIRIRGLQIWP